MFRGIFRGLLVGLFAVAPSSSSFTLKAYDFGNGSASSTSSSYKLDSNSGAQSANGLLSASYHISAGELPTQHANVPLAPTLTNPSSYYNRLLLVLNTANNPTTTKYLIAISSNGFSTTQYVQTDNSIGNSYTISNYQTYASWGGAGGFLILGLTPSTNYQVKVRALQGNFSETAYGPATGIIATVATSLSFGVTTTLTVTPPFTVGFSGLVAGSVFSGDADILLALSSNALSGGSVYVQDASSGLASVRAGFTIPSATADLNVATSGFGAQVISATQTSGGPFVSQVPFNGVTNNVGLLTTVLRSMLSSTAPIITGTATVRLKARADAITPSSSDYSDGVTFVAAMTF